MSLPSLPAFLADIHSPPDETAGAFYLVLILTAFAVGIWQAWKQGREDDRWRRGMGAMPDATEGETDRRPRPRDPSRPAVTSLRR